MVDQGAYGEKGTIFFDCFPFETGERKLTGFKNLYIASQWIMAPGGLPVAVTAGKFAVWRIARKDKRMIEFTAKK